MLFLNVLAIPFIKLLLPWFSFDIFLSGFLSFVACIFWFGLILVLGRPHLVVFRGCSLLYIQNNGAEWPTKYQRLDLDLLHEKLLLNPFSYISSAPFCSFTHNAFKRFLCSPMSYVSCSPRLSSYLIILIISIASCTFMLLPTTGMVLKFLNH